MRAGKRLPLLRRPEVRRSMVERVRAFLRLRRRVYERLGSDRLSHPALNEMDRKLEHYLPHRGGVFVEVGANDGYRQSNTYYLERFKGWSGVLVEAIPSLYRTCRSDRGASQVFNCALVAEGGPSELPMEFHDLMSVSSDMSFEGDVTFGWEQIYEVTVPARTLTSVLDEARLADIDLLSLDVEGQEPDVLRGLDLDRYAPRFVLVETNDAEPAIEALLGRRYERVDDLSPGDVLYRRRTS